MNPIDSTAKALVQHLNQRLAPSNTNPQRTAEELIAHVLQCGPLEIYFRDGLSANQLAELEPLAARIEAGEPLQYVIGWTDFRGLEIKCDSRALIPRPETEQLVDEVLNADCWQQPAPDLIEVGTGSGCIICALATERPQASYTAVDISPAALSLAKENAAALQLTDRITFRENSLLDGFEANSADTIVANLPYIATAAWENLEPCVRNHEPQLALDSGPSGMELIEILAQQARTVLRPGGQLFLEYGFDQGPAVRTCLEQAGYTDIRILQDYANLDRMAAATNP